MESLIFNSRSIGQVPCKIRRNRRSRGVSLRVRHDHLVATLPHGVHHNSVSELISENLEKIETALLKLREQEEQFFLREPSEFRAGSKIPFRGEMKSLKVVFSATPRPSFKFVNGQLELCCRPIFSQTYQETIKRKLIEFYYSELKAELLPIIEKYQKLFGVRIKSVRIKSQRSRWGSCSSLGNVNINWRLIFAPSFVLEAVVAHELCHFHHPDHSPAFYNKLSSICDKQERSDRWLKDNGNGIMRLFSEF